MTLPSTTCTTGATALAGGTYGVTASYAGDANFASSVSAPTAFVVNRAPTSTSLVLSTATVHYGASPVFTAQVSSPAGGAPTGTIAVETVVGGSTATLCTITLPGTSCTGTGIALQASPSPYSVLAVYTGDASYLGSTSPSQNLTVNTAQSTTTIISVTPSTVVYGNEHSVDFAVQVLPETAGTPTGTVTLQATMGSATVTLCTVTLSGAAGSCLTTDTALEASSTPYQVAGRYSGDTNFLASMSASSGLTVTQATTSTGVTVTPATVTYGDLPTLAFTATVTPQFHGTPTDTVAITSGSIALCTVTLSGGTGTCSPTAGVQLPAGANDVTGTYGGDTNFTPSVDTVAGRLTVNQATSSVHVQVAPSSVVYGAESAAVFTVTVEPEFSGTPTGTVTLTSGSVPLCAVTLVSGTGTGTCSPPEAGLLPGTYVVDAPYPGDANFTASSGSTSLTVTRAPVSLSLASSADPSFPGRPVRFTATVATGSGLAGPTGTVTFSEGGTTLCAAVAVHSGIAACTTTLPVTPAQTITATYSGDGNYAGATATTVQHVLHGYWLVARDGGVFAFGAAAFYGSMGGKSLNRPVVGIAGTADGGGYWLVAADGGLFAFGDAGFYGSTGSQKLNSPVVGMQPTPDGRGYWLVAADGGIFAFGDAGFYGSTGALKLNAPVVGMVATADGKGYFLVASDGGVFAFGDARFEGTGGFSSPSPVVGLAATPTGAGYWLATANGGVYSFGDATAHGSMANTPLKQPIVGIGATSDGDGYWLVASDGGVFAFGNAIFDGSTGSLVLNSPMVSLADI